MDTATSHQLNELGRVIITHARAIIHKAKVYIMVDGFQALHGMEDWLKNAIPINSTFAAPRNNLFR